MALAWNGRRAVQVVGSARVGSLGPRVGWVFALHSTNGVRQRARAGLRGWRWSGHPIPPAFCMACRSRYGRDTLLQHLPVQSEGYTGSCNQILGAARKLCQVELNRGFSDAFCRRVKLAQRRQKDTSFSSARPVGCGSRGRSLARIVSRQRSSSAGSSQRKEERKKRLSRFELISGTFHIIPSSNLVC